MQQTTNISINMIQPEPAYNPGDLVRTIQQTNYWSQLGSSKNRTSVQQEMGQNIIHEFLSEAPVRSCFAFTDGSCLENPGPCGAGAVIFFPDETSGLELTRPVAGRGSILLAELIAILMVLELAVSKSKKISDFSSSLQIFSDSQSAVGILTLNWASTNFTVLISQIKSLLNQLQSTAFEVSKHWTPGHATIAGNEIADRLAKDAAQQAPKMPMDTSVVTNQDIKSAAKKSTISKWQQRWDISETGRFLYTFKPLVEEKLYLDLPSKDLFPIIHQLRTGYCKLNEYRFKLNQSGPGSQTMPSSIPDSKCPIEHYIFDGQWVARPSKPHPMVLVRLTPMPDEHASFGHPMKDTSKLKPITVSMVADTGCQSSIIPLQTTVWGYRHRTLFQSNL